MLAKTCLRSFLFGLIAAAAVLQDTGTVVAQVTEIVVGITPNCPYGFPACWAGAKEAVEKLDGVMMVASTPDNYNCTARVRLKHDGLPDLVAWPKQFDTLVGQAHSFRGVEITVSGRVVPTDDKVVLKVPGLQQEFTLAPLQHKLQWNFKKRAARQPEPDEQEAYRELAAEQRKAPGRSVQAEVTGPLRQTEKGLVLEVREFFLAPSQRDIGR